MTVSNTWRVSSYSGQNNDCVELNVKVNYAKIRDSKNRATGRLIFGVEEWSAFLGAVKADNLTS